MLLSDVKQSISSMQLPTRNGKHTRTAAVTSPMCHSETQQINNQTKDFDGLPDVHIYEDSYELCNGGGMQLPGGSIAGCRNVMIADFS